MSIYDAKLTDDMGRGKLYSLTDLVKDILAYSYFTTNKRHKNPIYIKLQYPKSSTADDPVLLITGQNASGKSFFGKCFCEFAKTKRNITTIASSMRMRTSGGISIAFMYGSEQWQATGEISSDNIQGAVSTSLGGDYRHFVLLDEPEIGLSDNYKEGAALFLVDYIRKAREVANFEGLILITHSALILDVFRRAGHTFHLRVGDSKTLDHVIDEPPCGSIEEFLALKEKSVETFRKINKIMKG